MCISFVNLVLEAATGVAVEVASNSVPAAELVSKGHSAVPISFIDLFLQADFVVKAVILILIAASIWSWAIIIDKSIDFIKTKRAIKTFEMEFWSGKSLEELFKQAIARRDGNPFAQVLMTAIHELNATENIKVMPISNKGSICLRVTSAMQVACNRVIAQKENYLSFLATAASSSPFIGLFGTVWGIMNSFQAITASKNTTLAVVAPGIAEALLATACGFMVAIPAAIFYNKLSQEVNKLSGKIENFAIELANIIARDLDKS